MHISVASAALLDDILAIENEAFTCPWSRKSFEEAFSSDHIMVYAAFTDDGILCGFSCLLVIAEDAELLNIAVASAFRRQGIADHLMERMLADAASQNAEQIYLEVRSSNLTAQNLYSKHGFEKLGIRRRYYANPVEDAIIMRRMIHS